jgi:hypothetical protein
VSDDERQVVVGEIIEADDATVVDSTTLERRRIEARLQIHRYWTSAIVSVATACIWVATCFAVCD